MKRIEEAARIALDAYEDRFESTRGKGNYVGPIDEEMRALRLALTAHTRTIRRGLFKGLRVTVPDKYTPWFPPELFPVRDGVYIVSASPSDTDDLEQSGRINPFWYAKFKDGRWFKPHSAVLDAAREQRLATYRTTNWKGLAKRQAKTWKGAK